MNIPAPFTKNQTRFFFDCFDHWFNVAEGGKRGGKNVLITMAYCTILEKHPSRIHLIAGVSTATARLNILDCDGFGLKNYFEGRCREGTYQNRDCLYIQTATGEKVVLVSGGGKAGIRFDPASQLHVYVVEGGSSTSVRISSDSAWLGWV